MKNIFYKDDILEMFLYDDKFNEFTKRKKDIYDLKREFKVLYEDQNILIVDKPVGLLVHDAKENVNTLSHQVLSYLKEKLNWM